MKISFLGDFRQKLLQGLENADINAYYLLLAQPDLIDDEVAKHLHEALQAPAISLRIIASEALCVHGDNAGIKNLCYNSMRFHPLLQIDQKRIPSGWSSASALRHANLLDESSVKLLFDESVFVNEPLHADLIAAATNGAPDSSLIDLLSSKEPVLELQAAYALAVRGNNVGRGVLTRAVASRNFIYLAITGLSHMQDAQDRANVASFFSNNNNSKNQYTYFEDFKFLFNVSQLGSAERLERLCKEFSIKNNASSPNVSNSEIKFLKFYAPSVGYFPDFACAFLEPEQLALLFRMQKAAVNGALQQNEIDLNNYEHTKIFQWEKGFVPNAFNDKRKLSGFEIEFETTDFLTAATNWINQPSNYQVGFLDKCKRLISDEGWRWIS